MAHEPERAVAGSVAFLQLGRARMQESFHAKWIQQRVEILSHLGGQPFIVREVS